MITNAKEIEESVLGLSLRDEDACIVMLSELITEDFTGAYQKIFEAIKNLFSNDAPINSSSLKNYIRESDMANDVGGLSVGDHLIESAKNVQAGGMAAACGYLKKYTKRRNLIGLCVDYNDRAKDRNADTEELLAQAGTDFFDLLSENKTSRIHPSSASILEEFESLKKPIDKSNRIYTGLDLDKIVKGFRPGQLIVVGGKTSHGKSVFTQNIIYNAAMSGIHSGLITMEMTNKEVTERIFSMSSQVDYEKVKDHNFSNADAEKLENSTKAIHNSIGYTIVDESMTNDRLYATARRLHVKNSMKILVVDYLQQVQGEGNSREQEVASVVQNLKKIATDLMIPVIALSQFNRSVDGRPQLHQFRESGAIEQWANTAILLWNPGVDGIEKFPDTYAEGKWAGVSTQNIIELHVAKNRGGRTGSVKVGFDGATQRFYNLSKEPQNAMDYLSTN